MNPAPASSAPSETPPALSAATEVPAEPPAAPPVPVDASAPITDASLQDMLAESSEASVDQMMTSMLPYLTVMFVIKSSFTCRSWSHHLRPCRAKLQVAPPSIHFQ
ncbi:hypothetical protein PI125_g26053 [Phytophthora idaei]|nr:hypothetical protein PI125_g26053 [Phytophthora idaei]KAG3123141.1 hypothetical protein PI126_g23845 [Phytophthora idaei]